MMMKKTLFVAFWGVCVLALSGCGSGGREGLAKEAIATMNDMASALESAKNADEAKPKLEAALTKLKDIKKREDAMGKPSKAEEEALTKKLQPEMTKVQERMASAMKQLATKDPQGLPKIMSIFTEMASWKQ
jgi:biopolymer transport protein ExbB/TolQ